MVEKIKNVKNDPKINRANNMMLKIDRILQLNNQKGDPDAEGNDDKQFATVPRMNIKLEIIEQEMKNILELFNDLRVVVEDIKDINAKNEFRQNIAKLENDRLDIIDEVQDKIAVRDRENAPAPEEKGENAPVAINSASYLIFEGGGSGVFKDWT